MNYRFAESSSESLKFELGSKIDNNSFSEHYDKSPLFCYDYIDISKTKYCFSQQCFDNHDIVKYFETVKVISKKTVNDLIDKSDHIQHFHIINYPSQKIRKLLSEINNNKQLKDEQIPPIGQFALYTNKEIGSRENGIKSPRIFFMIGANAVFYPLFYDPYHEISSRTNN